MRVDIVGAGPVGLGLAIQLLNETMENGLNVQVWERAPHPGSTPCGEGVLAAHLDLIPGVDHARHAKAKISEVHVEGPAPPILVLRTDAVVLDRPAWIAALADRAQGLGAAIHWSTSLSTAAVTRLPGDIVVGADGPASRVAQLLEVTRKMIPALQVRCPASAPIPPIMKFVWRPDDGFDYGWLFPRGDEAHVGLLGTHDPENRKRVLELARSHGLDPKGARFHAWPIPVGGRRVQRGRYCLVGDAAGVAHPLTKAGIAPGLLQAELLSRLIRQGRTSNYQRAYRESPLWPDHAMKAWNTLRERGCPLWKRTRWPRGPTFRLSRNKVRRLAIRTGLANGFRPSLLRDLFRVARGLRHAVEHGW